MKRIYGLFMAVLSLGLCIACTKGNGNGNGDGNGNGSGDGDGNDNGAAVEILPMTKEMNALSGALVASDSEYDYFQNPDGDRIVLCKRDRKSGELTVLAERPWDKASGADVTFTDLCLEGSYLYFTLFDPAGGIRYALCRVSVDASSEYETVHEFGGDYEGFHFDKDNTYMEVESDSGSSLKVLDYETGALEGGFPVPEDFSTKFIHEGWIYGSSYTKTDGKLHMQLFRCRAGSTETELVWSDPDQQTLFFTAMDSKLYIADPYGMKLYSADMDGKNPSLLLENLKILRMNVHGGCLYLLLDSGSANAPGLYSYTPGGNGLTALYESGSILSGPFITGTGDIWFTAAADDTQYRLGRLQYLDSSNSLHQI